MIFKFGATQKKRRHKKAVSWDLTERARVARFNKLAAQKAKIAKRGKGKKQAQTLSQAGATARKQKEKLTPLRSEAIAALKASRAELVKIRAAVRTKLDTKYRASLHKAAVAVERYEKAASEYAPTASEWVPTVDADADSDTLAQELDDAIAAQIETVETYITDLRGEK